MTASTANLTHSHADFGVSPSLRFVKRILNQLGERAEAAVDRSRLAALGMTVGERAAIVGCEEQGLDPWALAATQRL